MIWRAFCRLMGWSPGWGYTRHRQEVDDLLRGDR